MKNFYAALLLMLGFSIHAAADNWMSRLPDNLYVAQVSIPGAHDAATGNGVSLATFSQCQDLDVAAQWALGVRAFDLRPIVKDDHLHINHGIAETELRFDDALFLLRDSLVKNPSEFAVVHLLYADGFEDDKETYKTMLLELLQSDELKDYVVDFRQDLTVGEMRGKILLMSRDQYDTKPVGAFMTGWCGWIDWNAQTAGRVYGAGTGVTASSPLYMQDLSDTHEDGKQQEKVDAIGTMLDFSTQHVVKDAADIVWVYNFASAYSKVTLGISTSTGYRDNATHTHAAIIEYFQTHEAGPAGIVLMDFVGVDEANGYATRGKEVVDTLIANNFKWLARRNEEGYGVASKRIDRMYTKLEDTREKIATECPDVAAGFEDDLEEAKADIDSIKAEVDSLYEACLLTESYEVEGYGDVIRLLSQILEDAEAAQAAYEESVPVGTVRADGEKEVSRIYSVTGEQLDAPRRGAVNIVKYTDGTVRKVRY